MTNISQFDHNAPDFIANPYPVYAHLQEHDPVHFSTCHVHSAIPPQ